MASLNNRIAVVTGSGRGIGRSIALRLAKEGATVVLSSRTQDEIDSVEAEITAQGGNGAAVIADATNPDEARRPVRDAIEHYGRIDILVNNVGGVIGNHNTLNGGDESFEATIRLNLLSPWWTSSAALPAMMEQGYGRIINIGSTESLRAHAGCPPAYVAGKHGLVGLTRQLAQDAGESGVTVNCICPGWTNTSMVDFEALGRAQGISAAEARAIAAASSSQNCILEPDDIAQTAVFLASDHASRITGQVISVDGGYRL